MSTLRIERITHEDPQVWPLYESAFPACERRSAAHHHRALGDAEFFAHTIYSGEQFAGLVHFWQWGDMAYIEHLATSPEVRGGGIGGRVVEWAKEATAGKLLVLEIEPPVDELTCRREGFYKRHGLVSNPQFEHIHPSYSQETDPHQLILMSWPRPITQAEFDEFRRYLLGRVLAYSDR